MIVLLIISNNSHHTVITIMIFQLLIYSKLSIIFGTDHTPYIHCFRIQVGLHTCFHSWNHDPKKINTTMIHQHERDIKKLMQAVHTAIHRPLQRNSGTTNGTMMGSNIVGNHYHFYQVNFVISVCSFVVYNVINNILISLVTCLYRTVQFFVQLYMTSSTILIISIDKALSF